jgi:hypothetical protein
MKIAQQTLLYEPEDFERLKTYQKLPLEHVRPWLMTLTDEQQLRLMALAEEAQINRFAED